MPYYAHIRQDENGETVYQTVAEHLTGTAALCREFAAGFGAEADGDLMGLAHDLGKCTDAFQKECKCLLVYCLHPDSCLEFCSAAC